MSRLAMEENFDVRKTLRISMLSVEMSFPLMFRWAIVRFPLIYYSSAARP
jgi:hypothetical protein